MLEFGSNKSPRCKVNQKYIRYTETILIARKYSLVRRSDASHVKLTRVRSREGTRVPSLTS